MKQFFKRRLVRWGTLSLLLLVALAFLPSLILATPAADMIVRSVTKDVQGEVTVAAISAGWFSEITLRDVRVTDGEGNEVATVESLRTGKTIVSLWQSPSEWLDVRVSGMHASVKLRNDGSNVEDVLRKLIAKPAGKKPLRLKLSGAGSAAIADDSGRTHQLSEMQLDVEFDESGKRVHVASKLDHASTSSVDATLKTSKDKASLFDMQVTATRFPLQLLVPVLARFGCTSQLAGDVTGKCRYVLGSESHSVQWSDLKGHEVAMADPKVLGSERLFLSKLNSAGELTVRGAETTVANVVLDSELAKVRLVGAMQLPALNGLHELNWLVNHDYDVQGEVNLARLAELFPKAMNLRKATKLRAGKVIFALRSKEVQQQPRNRMVGGQESIGSRTSRSTLSLESASAFATEGPHVEH